MLLNSHDNLTNTDNQTYNICFEKLFPRLCDVIVCDENNTILLYYSDESSECTENLPEKSWIIFLVCASERIAAKQMHVKKTCIWFCHKDVTHIMRWKITVTKGDERQNWTIFDGCQNNQIIVKTRYDNGEFIWWKRVTLPWFCKYIYRNWT